MSFSTAIAVPAEGDIQKLPISETSRPLSSIGLIAEVVGSKRQRRIWPTTCLSRLEYRPYLRPEQTLAGTVEFLVNDRNVEIG